MKNLQSSYKPPKERMGLKRYEGDVSEVLVVYASLTGNVERFVKKLDGVRAIRLEMGLKINEPFILLTYTTGFGEVPQLVDQFLKNNHQYLRGVAASGNRNWGKNFTRSAVTISETYNVPILHRFELSGTDEDVEIFTREVVRLAESEYQ